MADVGNLALKLSMSARSFFSDADKVQAKINDIEKSVKPMGSAFSSAFSSFSSGSLAGMVQGAEQLARGLGQVVSRVPGAAGVASSLGGIAPIAGAAAVGVGALAAGFVKLGLEGAGFVKQQGRLARGFGVSHDFAATLQAAAARSGTSVEQLAGGLGKFQERLGELRAENSDLGGMSATFARWGLDVRQMKDSGFEENLASVVRRFHDIKDASSRAAFARDILGKGWHELEDLLHATGGSFDSARDAAHRFGLALPVDQIAKLRANMKGLKEEQSNLGLAWEGLRASAAGTAVESVLAFGANALRISTEGLAGIPRVPQAIHRRWFESDESRSARVEAENERQRQQVQKELEDSRRTREQEQLARQQEITRAAERMRQLQRVSRMGPFEAAQTLGQQTRAGIPFLGDDERGTLVREIETANRALGMQIQMWRMNAEEAQTYALFVRGQGGDVADALGRNRELQRTRNRQLAEDQIQNLATEFNWRINLAGLTERQVQIERALAEVRRLGGDEAAGRRFLELRERQLAATETRTELQRAFESRDPLARFETEIDRLREMSRLLPNTEHLFDQGAMRALEELSKSSPGSSAAPPGMAAGSAQAAEFLNQLARDKLGPQTLEDSVREQVRILLDQRRIQEQHRDLTGSLLRSLRLGGSFVLTHSSPAFAEEAAEAIDETVRFERSPLLGGSVARSFGGFGAGGTLGYAAAAIAQLALRAGDEPLPPGTDPLEALTRGDAPEFGARGRGLGPSLSPGAGGPPRSADRAAWADGLEQAFNAVLDVPQNPRAGGGIDLAQAVTAIAAMAADVRRLLQEVRDNALETVN